VYESTTLADRQMHKEIYVSDKKTVFVTVSNEAWDGLCIFSGNSYKADSWLAKYVMDVANLSDDAIRSYLRIMFKKAVSERNYCQEISTKGPIISSVISHVTQ
jgi:hypothetical protein